jgi:acyl-CoA synthetase (AMP-forming)/AMP-acid ligase II/1-acyl-sn-glycerol-3-phosphate acyltransferase/acyl carrier protein
MFVLKAILATNSEQWLSEASASWRNLTVIVFRWVCLYILRVLLGARYRIRVHGKEQLRNLQGPILILPNHPGYIDPFLLFAVLWPSVRMRPLVYRGTFQGLTGRFLVRLVNALEVPDLDVASVRARTEIEEAVAAIAAGLARGERFILWPAGRVWREGLERIGPARAAADILRAVPQANVLLVRTRGLWGSSWTWAQLNARAKLLYLMVAGLGWIVANALFLLPRRRVEITVALADRRELPEPRREVLNPWLEQWYNGDLAGCSEKPTWVPYHFLVGRRTFDFPPTTHPEVGSEVGPVRPETRQAVLTLVADRLQRPLAETEQQPTIRLDDLGLDSLDRMELSLQVERQFGFSGDEACETVGQLLTLAEGRARRQQPKPPPPHWTRTPSRHGPLQLRGDTIPAAFVELALTQRNNILVADDLAGALTGERLLVGVLTLAKRLAHLPAANIGVLLPASVACDIVLMALYLAGKLPVVLNWTTGPANLAHAARLMKLSHVVTSKTFVDRTGIAVAGTDYLFLEDIRATIGKVELLRSLARVRWRPGSIRRLVPPILPDRPAVVLFTSGSEKAPKAVPLTHANILCCQRAAMTIMGVTAEDVVLGFLPAFHSFGMTVTTLLPLLIGVRVVHHPDPTDAASLVHKIKSYGATVLVGTPTFIHYMLERSGPGGLPSVRLIVVGAERCPPALFDRCREVAPRAVVLEGYGITECAPVVSVNPPTAPRPGSIGKPLPGVDVRVVDLEDGSEVTAGQLGMLHVSGPTVFPGYLGQEGPAPFIEDRGRRWYVTGDLGEFDADGYLWFRGRLRRFLKAGGEMISLPALEEPFTHRYPPTTEGPCVAVEGIEYDGGRHIVLFTTEPLTLRDANALLLQEGFHGVMRLDEVRLVESIPLLGTGKIDYKQLRALILESRLDSTPRTVTAPP